MSRVDGESVNVSGSSHKFNKFMVFNHSDLAKYLSVNEMEKLNAICNKIEDGRIRDDKPMNDYWVVNHDEEYAKEVENLIKDHH